MDGDNNWANLPADILIAIVDKLSCLQDYIGIRAVCKSWKSGTTNYKPLLPPRYPLLLLAEDVVSGSIISDGEFDSDDSTYSADSAHYFYYDEDNDEDGDDNSQSDDSVHSNDGDENNDDNVVVDNANNDAGVGENDNYSADNANNHAVDGDNYSADNTNNDAVAGENANYSADNANNDAVAGENDNYSADNANNDVVAGENDNYSADNANNDAVAGENDNNSDSDDDDDDSNDDDVAIQPYDKHDHRNNSIGSSRGLYSLSSGKTYMLELPEASGRLILGANHGWLLTLGRDLQIHLLHPLLRYQIPLPPMLTFPTQYIYGTPEYRSDMFIHKAALSSNVPTKGAFNLHDPRIVTDPPTVMVSYGEFGCLAFVRFQDKIWTPVEIQSRPLHDLVYHKGRFYTVNNGGEVYVCDIQNGCGRPRATKIASLPFETYQSRKYLVESVSGTLFLLVRFCKTKNFYPLPKRSKYRTTCFALWTMELQNCDDPLQIPSCTLKMENNIGNQAIFVGRNTSVAISASETIKPNCIYFTDDRVDYYHRVGGGHDMGIFSIEDHTIEPHFPGKSIHFISPPLWYI